MKLTKNFDISEFECKCGCYMPEDVKGNVIKLANQLQTLRDYIQKPITLTNAYRCPKHNKAVGGVPNSQHVLGKAADLKVGGVYPKHLATMIETLIDKGDLLQGGIGVYNTFTHYDIRKTKSRWDYRG